MLTVEALRRILGPDLEAGQRPQVVVPRETAPRASLLATYPAAKDPILALTR